MYPPFDPAALETKLGELREGAALAFGVAALSRLLGTSLRFVAESEGEDTRVVSHALTVLGGVARGTATTPRELASLARDCMDAAPSSEDHESLYASGAEGLCLGLADLASFVENGDLSDLADAVTHVTDFVDLYIQEIADMDPQRPDLEAAILHHPLMQQELARQARDLADTNIGLVLQRMGEDLLELEGIPSNV